MQIKAPRQPHRGSLRAAGDHNLPRGTAMYSTLHAYLIWYVTQERVRAGGRKSATLD